MAIFDLFSKRQQKSQGNSSEVFAYDEVPHELRIQFLHALDDARTRIYDRTIPSYRALGTEGTDIFSETCLVLRRELGLGRLIEIRKRVHHFMDTQTKDLSDEFVTFFENCEVGQVLDAIEIVMHFIKQAEQNRLLDEECNSLTVAKEINQRFLQHGIGYQYQSGQIIVQSNSLLHAEAIKPALSLLSDPQFDGANEEFLKAHEHYRHGRFPECLVDCLKAFESTMKIVCDLNSWPYQPTDTAKKLIEACLSNKLVPTYSQQQLTSLRTLLESGMPTVRNKQAGHGQGSTRHQVSGHLARFAINVTASAIVLLVESHKDRKP